ncbi:MAG: hypothetical protein R3F14_47200 [Polyangiaceae bacterium]
MGGSLEIDPAEPRGDRPASAEVFVLASATAVARTERSSGTESPGVGVQESPWLCGAVPEPGTEAWDLEQALREYEAYRRGDLRPAVEVFASELGELHLAGLEREPERCAVTHVRRGDGAVSPVVAGPFQKVQLVSGWLSFRGAFEELAANPPRMIVRGQWRHFRPTFGCHLLGIVEISAHKAVLLIAYGESFAAVYVDPEDLHVLHVGVSQGLRELDVDAHLRLARITRRRRVRQRPTRSSSASARRKIPKKVQREHERIVYGKEVDVGDGPSVLDVLMHCFAGLTKRASEAVNRAAGERARGIRRVPDVLAALLSLRVTSDPIGRVKDLAALLNAADHDLQITPKKLGEVFRLLHRTGTVLLDRVSRGIWRLRLIGLDDPRSAHHQALLAETGTCFSPPRSYAEASKETASAPTGSKAEATIHPTPSPSSGEGGPRPWDQAASELLSRLEIEHESVSSRFAEVLHAARGGTPQSAQTESATLVARVHEKLTQMTALDVAARLDAGLEIMEAMASVAETMGDGSLVRDAKLVSGGLREALAACDAEGLGASVEGDLGVAVLDVGDADEEKPAEVSQRAVDVLTQSVSRVAAPLDHEVGDHQRSAAASTVAPNGEDDEVEEAAANIGPPAGGEPKDLAGDGGDTVQEHAETGTKQPCPADGVDRTRTEIIDSKPRGPPQ